MIGEDHRPDQQGLEELLDRLDALAQVDLAALTDSELHDQVEGWAQARSRLEGIGTRLVGEWDARMIYAERGAVNAAAWLRTHTDVEGAGRIVKRARQLRTYAPVTAAALVEGSLSYEKAMAIVAPVTHDLAAAFAVSEAAIVETAKTVTLEDTQDLVVAWRAIAENDLDVDVWARQLRKRYLRVWDNPDGTLEGTFLLDSVSGATFRAELAVFERRLFRDDVREARATAGLPPDPDAGADGLTLPRTPAQRRADALCDVVGAGARVDPTADDGHLPAPSGELVITMSDDHLAALTTAADDPDGHDADHECGCADGTCKGAVSDHQDHPVPAALVALMACDSVIRRMVLDRNGVAINMGRAVRRATPAQLRALRQRDGERTPQGVRQGNNAPFGGRSPPIRTTARPMLHTSPAFPGCGRPASWCDAHHILWWILFGPTDLDNLTNQEAIPREASGGRGSPEAKWTHVLPRRRRLP